jgi:hypothetical protein
MDVRPLEDRAGADGKVRLALIAAVVAALARSDTIADAAGRTTRTVWPEPTFQVNASRLLVGEHLKKLENRDGAATHSLSLCPCSKYRDDEQGSQVYNSRM